MEAFLTEYSAYLSSVRRVSGNTLQSYLRDIRQFLDCVGAAAPGLIDCACVSGYLSEIKAAGRSASTCKRVLSSLKCYFSFLEETRRIPQSPVQELHSDACEKKLPEILTDDEINCLLGQPDISTIKGCRDKAILELLYATGIKASEVVAINREDIDLKNAFLRCRSGRKERVIPLYPAAVSILSRYYGLFGGEAEADGEGSPFFVNMNSGRLSRQGIWKIIKQYAQSAGISKAITPQTLRHSFAAHLMKNGAQLKDVQKMLGHADISSTQVYLRLADEHCREVYLQCHPRARESQKVV